MHFYLFEDYRLVSVQIANTMAKVLTSMPTVAPVYTCIKSSNRTIPLMANVKHSESTCWWNADHY